MPPFGTVGQVTTAKSMPLHNTLEAPALAHTNGINEVTFGEDIGPQHIAGFDRQREVAKLLHPLDRRRIVFAQMTVIDNLEMGAFQVPAPAKSWLRLSENAHQCRLKKCNKRCTNVVGLLELVEIGVLGAE